MFIAGITGVFSIVESIAGNIEVEFNMSRKKAVSITIAILMSFAYLFCMGNASHLIDALVPMVIGTNMLIGGLALILIFKYACQGVRHDPLWYSGNKLNFYGFCLRYVAPVVLGIILIGNLNQEFQSFDIAKGVRWTWFGIALLSAALLSQLSKSEEKVKAFA